MGRLPTSKLTLSGEIREQRRRIADKGTTFEGTGLHFPEPGVVQAEGDLDVTGNLNVSGHAVITGTLSLPAGIIDNAALANPVVPQSVWKGTTANFGLNTGWTALTSQTQAAPPEANSVIVHGFVRLVAENTTASVDYLYSDLDIGGQSCGGFPSKVDAGDVGTSFCSFARVLTGVSSVTLTAYGSTGLASWASTDNVCQISASVLWFR